MLLDCAECGKQTTSDPCYHCHQPVVRSACRICWKTEPAAITGESEYFIHYSCLRKIIGEPKEPYTCDSCQNSVEFQSTLELKINTTLNNKLVKRSNGLIFYNIDPIKRHGKSHSTELCQECGLVINQEKTTCPSCYLPSRDHEMVIKERFSRSEFPETNLKYDTGFANYPYNELIGPLHSACRDALLSTNLVEDEKSAEKKLFTQQLTEQIAADGRRTLWTLGTCIALVFIIYKVSTVLQGFLPDGSKF